MPKRTQKVKAKPTSDELYDLLKLKYPVPSWALLPQVANGTGFRAYRWADGVALCCYPSLGLELHGFEIKVSRSDFLNELKDGEKSNAVFQYCDRWYLVVADKDIVKEGELPPTWGMLYPKGGRLYAAPKAPKLKPKPLQKEFVASVLRNAIEIVVPDSKLEERYRAGKAEGLKEGRELKDYESKGIRKQHDSLMKSIQAFEKAVGHPWPYVSEWSKEFHDHKLLGEAIRFMMKGEYADKRKQLERLRDDAKRIHDSIQNVLDGKEE